MNLKIMYITHEPWWWLCAFINQALKNFQADNVVDDDSQSAMRQYENLCKHLVNMTTVQHRIHITTVCTRNLNTSIQLIYFYFLHYCCCWRSKKKKVKITIWNYLIMLLHSLQIWDFFLLPKKPKYKRKRNWTLAKVFFKLSS